MTLSAAKPRVRTVEYGVFRNPSNCHGLEDWRCYRVEYGFECGCPEGVVWLPPDVNQELFEEAMKKLIEGSRRL